MKKPLEKEIQKSILDYLKLKGYMAWKNSTVGIFNKKSGGYIPSQSVGAPDIFMLTKGVFWGIEVKTPTGKLSDNQKHFGGNIKANGGKYLVAYSVDDVIKAGL